MSHLRSSTELLGELIAFPTVSADSNLALIDHLANRLEHVGARVRVLDRRGVGAGASGGIVGALAPHVPENWNPKKAFQLDSLLMAEGFWAGVRAVSGVDPGYARLGRLQPLADARAVDLAHERESSAAALWGDAAEWRVIDSAATGARSESSRLKEPSGNAVADLLTA